MRPDIFLTVKRPCLAYSQIMMSFFDKTQSYSFKGGEQILKTRFFSVQQWSREETFSLIMDKHTMRTVVKDMSEYVIR